MGRSLQWAAALVIVLGAIATRFTGLDWLLPSLIEPDAHMMVQVQLIESGDPEPARSINWGKYPHLVARTAAALTASPRWGALDPNAPIEEHLALANAPAVRVRWTVALYSLLVLPAVWLLARLCLERGWSLYATALGASSLLAVHFAVQGRPHGAAIAFPALAVVACVRLRRAPSWGSYALAALAAGLSLASLQSGVAAFLPLGVAHILTARGRGWSHHLKLLAPLVAFGLTLLLFYPFWLQGRDGGRVEVEGATLDQAGHKIFLDIFNGKGFPILLDALWSWEPVLFLGLLAGVSLWLARLRGARSRAGLALADRWIVLAYVLPYAFVIGLYQRSYERFLVPLVPFLALLTAWAARELVEAAKRGPRVLRAGSLLAVALALLLPAVVVGKLAYLRCAPSTYELAARWVEREVAPERQRVLLNVPLILPLFRSAAALEAEAALRVGGRNRLWYEYQSAALTEPRVGPAYDLRWIPLHKQSEREALLAAPAEYVGALQGEFALIEVFEEGRIHPSGNALVRALDARAELRARFSPDADPRRHDAPLVYQDETGGSVPRMAWRILGARHLGAVLQAYGL